MRVVVVGAGMVGHRMADELVRQSPDVEVDLLGAEPYDPYNRVLLTELLAGRVDLAGLALSSSAEDRVRLHLGTPATAIDRSRKVVLSGDREFHYDHLVLATGADARVVPIPGVTTDDELTRGVHVLRTLNDARSIKAASLNAQHAIVIGGGPLGLEAACALRARGVGVTVLCVEPTVLERDLDGSVGLIAAAAASDLGIDVVVSARIRRIMVQDGHTTGAELDDGRHVHASLVVLACGAVPSTSLAAESGLHTNRGIVVGADLRSVSDRSISAVGDCAETPDGISGLVSPGWAQARELARSLVIGGVVSPVDISGAAMRLKAVGMSVVSMGLRASTAGDADRVVSLHDDQARRHVEAVVRDDTLVGLTCVGVADIAAHLSTQFDRPGKIPDDPWQMLLGLRSGTAAPPASPTTMPAATTVCRCNGVTKGDLVHAWDGGATSVEELATATLATTGCGGCKELVCGIADWLTESDPPTSQPAPHDREAEVSWQ